MREINSKVKYRCPLCLQTLNDVNLCLDNNGIYRCTKCSYTGDEKKLFSDYDTFRSKYKWRKKRVTVEDLRRM